MKIKEGETKIDDKRNGFLPCIKHKKWKPVECSQRNICREIFAFKENHKMKDDCTPLIISFVVVKNFTKGFNFVVACYQVRVEYC